MATGKITKRSVDGVKPGPRDAYLWDSEIKGFALKVTPPGTRTYLFEYKAARRRTRRVTIGHHGKITPDQARKRAVQLAAEVELGSDPAAVIATKRQAPTVRELAEEWMADHVQSKRKTQNSEGLSGLAGPVRAAGVRGLRR